MNFDYTSSSDLSILLYLEPTLRYHEPSLRYIAVFSTSVIYKIMGFTSLMSDARNRAVSGVCSAGLITVVFPAARQGPNFQLYINIGKFH